MPPCSVLSIFCTCASLSGASTPSAHAAYFDLDVERRLVARVAIRVAQAGERLVQRVPRRPQAVEVEAARLDLAPRDGGERLAAVLERAQVAVAVLVLHFLQLAHEIVGALP